MSALNLLSQVFGMNMGMNGGLGGLGGQGVPGVFKQKYHAYSPAYWNSENRDKLEKGDKIVLPASALEQLSRMQVRFPIMFEIAHDSDILPKKSHCSVLEFTAAEGSVYLPLWMIDNLGLDACGDSIVELTTVNLAKGNFVQFQAHETKFAMLQNPRVVLEKALRNYSCLTVGDTIQIEFNNYIYKLDVTEVKPSVVRGTAPPAIDIIETDIKVDFKEPRDYKEWEKKQKAKQIDLPPGSNDFDHVNGVFRRSPSNDDLANIDSMNKNNGKNKGKNKNKNNNNNNNSSNNYNYESKMNELNNDGLFDSNEDGFMIQDWQSAKAKEKQGHFQSLQMSGSQGQKVRDKKSKSKSKQQSNNNNNNNNMNGNYNNNNNNNNASSSSRGAPLGGRGAPLGAKNNSPLIAPIGAPKKGVVKKTEEVIGNMRYIYEVDEMGNRTLIRRLPLRNLPGDSSKGYSLK